MKPIFTWRSVDGKRCRCCVRCWQAKGHKCVCACGGIFHGVGKNLADVVEQKGAEVWTNASARAAKEGWINFNARSIDDVLYDFERGERWKKEQELKRARREAEQAQRELEASPEWQAKQREEERQLEAKCLEQERRWLERQDAAEEKRRAERVAHDNRDPMLSFPMPKPRAHQDEAVRQIADYFKQSKFVLFEGPTGSGKSGVAVALARHYGSAYICTLTKSLQDQYANDPYFKPLGMVDLKGRGSFKCKRCAGNKHDTCKEGGMLFTGKGACTDCPYRIAKAKALAAPLTVCNYHSFLYNVAKAHGEEAPGPRPLIILDEAHELESVLMSHVSIGINQNTMPARIERVIPSDPKDVGAFFDWLAHAGEAMRQVASGAATVERKLRARELIGKIDFALDHRDDAQWIIELDETFGSRGAPHSVLRSTPHGFALKPITVAPFTRDFFRFGDRVLLMSATILDPMMMAESLGVPKGNADFVQVPSTFPPENRPVVAFNVDMHKESRPESWPVMVQAVTDIMRFHGGVKGLLLTPSNEMLKYLQDRLPPDCGKRLLLAYGDSRDAMLEQHRTGKAPTVLAASGMWEGVDLAGDQSRFQIIPALPRPFLSEQVKARMQAQPGWYEWKTMSRCVQGLGRSIRSENDSAFSYTLDADFARAMRNGSKLIPQWLREAVEVRD